MRDDETIAPNESPSPVNVPQDARTLPPDSSSDSGVPADDSDLAGGRDQFATTFEGHSDLPAGSSAADHAGGADSAPAGAPKIDGYRMVRKLGQGGMGAVFLAEDQRLSREVAVKIVSFAFHDTLSVKQRFEAEIRTLATLQHSHIAQLFSAGTYCGLPYFVMEYVNGPTLEEIAREPIKPRLAAEIVSKLCDAVEYCHQQGILHRDLKPSNVLMQHSKTSKNHSTFKVLDTQAGEDATVRSDREQQSTTAPPTHSENPTRTGANAERRPFESARASTTLNSFTPKIADFGLAKVVDADTSATRTGEVLGTPGYMPPEQAGGEAKTLSPACDVYSLGAILYRLLTGRPPFVASEPLQAVMQVLSKEPVRPRTLVANIPHELETICLKCLEKSPLRRYRTASELMDDLGRYLQGIPIEAKPANWIERSVKWSKRNPTLTLLYSGLVLSTMLGFGGLAWHTQVLSEELNKTQRLADHGTRLSKWLIQDHLASLNTVAGTTDSRHELVKQVQQYLDNSLADMPPDSKYTKQLGYSYTQLASVSGGDDQNNLGDLKTAETNYRKSLDLYDEALRRGEPESAILKLKTEALLSLAGVYREMQQYDASDKHLNLAETALQSIDTTKWDGLFLKIQWIEHHTERLMAKNQYEQALQQLKMADDLLAAATADANPLELKNQQIWISSTRSRCLEFLGRLDEAEQTYRHTVELAKAETVKYPFNALAKRRYASTLVQYADILFSRQQVSESLTYYQQALEIAKDLTSRDPASVELAVDLAIKYSRVCAAQRYLGDYQQADEMISEAIRIHDDLNARGKARMSLQQSLATYLLAKADVMMTSGNYEEAEKFFQRHRQLCNQLLEANANSITELNQLAEHHFQHAVMLVTRWFNNPIDAATARESDAYLEIVNDFEESLRYFSVIESKHTLDYHQQEYREQVKQLRALVEQSIDEMIQNAETVPAAAEDAAGTNEA
jgi:serine/threonine protein kinase